MRVKLRCLIYLRITEQNTDIGGEDMNFELRSKEVQCNEH